MDIILYIDYIFLIQKSLEKVYSITFKRDENTVKKVKKDNSMLLLNLENNEY